MRQPATLREAQAGQSFVSVKDCDSSYPTITKTKIIGTRIDDNTFCLANFASHLAAFDQIAPTNQ
jgi:hypothetical protein